MKIDGRAISQARVSSQSRATDQRNAGPNNGSTFYFRNTSYHTDEVLNSICFVGGNGGVLLRKGSLLHVQCQKQSHHHSPADSDAASR